MWFSPYIDKLKPSKGNSVGNSQCSSNSSQEREHKFELKARRAREACKDSVSVYVQQFSALYLKNGLVAWRNWRATIIRILAPLILLILALAINESLKANDRNSAGYKEVRHPAVQVIGPIPNCHEDMYIDKEQECEEVAFSPNNTVTQEIMRNVVLHNGKAITARPFATLEDVQDFLFDNPNFMIAAVHFVFNDTSANSTSTLPVLARQIISPGFNLSAHEPPSSPSFPPGLNLPPLSNFSSSSFHFQAPPDLPESASGRGLLQLESSVPVSDQFNLSSATQAIQGFIIQTNTTVESFKGEFQQPNNFVQIPLQNAVHREIARYQLRLLDKTEEADNLVWDVGLKPFPNPALGSNGVLNSILGPFVFAALMFSFVIQISTVVTEKELGLRQALRTMGMTDMAYWTSWGAWEVTLAFIQGHLVTIFGLILQFEVFLKNNYGLLFFLFFLFQLAMSSMALMLSSFLNRTQAAVYLGFVIFIVGWIMQAVVVFGIPYNTKFFMVGALGEALTVIFSVFPWSLLVQGFNALESATKNGNPGLKWSERSLYCRNFNSNTQKSSYRQEHGLGPNQYVDFSCTLSIDELYKILVILWIGFFLVAIYFDNVFRNEVGLRRNIFFFLFPSYWIPSVTSPRTALTHVLRDEGKGPEPDAFFSKDEDVMAEESAARTLLNSRTAGNIDKCEQKELSEPEAWNAIEVYGLKKNYGGTKGCCGHSLVCSGAYECCSCRARQSFWPIKDSWFVIPNNQLFCLLGPNGAGKTTTINTLIGMLPPTHGDALIHGQSVRSSGGLNKIRSMMGVCPQFDVLWPELTGREHLHLYGRIKSAQWNWKGVEAEAETLLKKVKLTFAADQHSGAYSGGMKRRLSVAIALLGDPRVVYLDEPTTGMDPISRRYVWDVIQESKLGRAIILTTHSMEEADILGDRIAIMALGRLRCIGSSLRLKQRFGAGFQISVSVQASKAGLIDPEEVEQRCNGVKQFLYEELKLQPVDEDTQYINYLIPREQEGKLVQFLEKLETRTKALGITDVQLSLASLEEVFLTIARKAALEAAKSEGMQLHAKELPFGSTVLKATLLGLFFPITIWAAPWWKRILVGKEDMVNANSKLMLPDGTCCEVDPGQEQVHDSHGKPYDIIWSLDDQGHLRAQDVKPATRSLDPGASSAKAGHGTDASSAVTSSLTKDGKATIQFPDAALFGVKVGETYVVHPTSGQGFLLEWGKGDNGPCVLRCTPSKTQAKVLPPMLGRAKAQALLESNTSLTAPWATGSISGLPVARPVQTLAPSGSPCCSPGCVNLSRSGTSPTSDKLQGAQQAPNSVPPVEAAQTSL